CDHGRMKISRWPEGVPVSRLLGKDLFPLAVLVPGLPVLALRISVEHSAVGVVGDRLHGRDDGELGAPLPACPPGGGGEARRSRPWSTDSGVSSPGSSSLSSSPPTRPAGLAPTAGRTPPFTATDR